MADFTAALCQQMDFTYEAKALDTLARDAEEFEMLRVPAVQRGLCTTRVMVVEELTGYRLDDVEFPQTEREEAAFERERARLVRDHLGHIAVILGDEIAGVYPTLYDAEMDAPTDPGTTSALS